MEYLIIKTFLALPKIIMFAMTMVFLMGNVYSFQPSAVPAAFEKAFVEVVAKLDMPLQINCSGFRILDNADAFLIWETNTRTFLNYNSSITDRIILENEILLEEDGSLHIDEVKPHHAGLYRCRMENFTSTILVRLDYTIVERVTLYSLMVGFSSAACFFLIAVILGAVRYLAHVCSDEERAKRRTFREVLAVIRSSSHMERLSAYKVAKMDQLSTFRSQTMDQLVAFKTAKIDKLRTYKCATVVGMQQYLERMREYYAAQTDKLKSNVRVHSDHLKANYTSQRRKLRGHKSVQVKKIRENYNAKRLKIREYSSTQMAKLREQYKAQQQHVIKLLELLDIGNCVNTIKDDCQRTESAIFDSLLSLDLELGMEDSLRDDEVDDELGGEEVIEFESGDELDTLDVDLDEDLIENNFITFDDIVYDISARVDMIRCQSMDGQLSVPRTREKEANVQGKGRVMSLTVSLRDLHQEHGDDVFPDRLEINTAAATSDGELNRGDHVDNRRFDSGPGDDCAALLAHGSGKDECGIGFKEQALLETVI